MIAFTRPVFMNANIAMRERESRHPLFGTIAVAIVTLAIVVVPAPREANASTGEKGSAIPAALDEDAFGDLDPQVLEVMRHQEALHPAIEILTETTWELPESGFAGISFEGDGLALYWKGGMPASMVSALATARTSGPVVVRSAPHSLAELEAAAAGIQAAAGRHNDIQSIEIRNDGSGLLIERMPPATAERVEMRSGAALTTAERAIAAAEVAVPVQVTTAARTLSPMACSGACRRTNDEAWWNSGGYVKMRHDAGQPYYASCTSGFAVQYLGTTFLLTAAHCATWHAGQGDFFYDGAGELIGRASVIEDWQRDIMLIDARGWYWMWYGGTTTTTHRTVHSWGNPASGQLLCHSGAASGVQCNLKRDLLGGSYQVTDSDGDTFIVQNMYRACRSSATAASLVGDSGSPVFTLDGDGVRAMGVLSGGDGDCIIFQDMYDVTHGRSGAWPSSIVPYTG